MKSVWDATPRRELSDRIGRLVQDARPQWGRMSAQQMVCHLIGNMQMANGEKAVTMKWTPFRIPGIKEFVLYYAPFPRNVPTAPELIITATPNAWEHDLAELRSALDRFVDRGVDARWPEHPAFGPLSGLQWGVLVYRHVDHHLRQFGV
jgi:hypothetical protein